MAFGRWSRRSHDTGQTRSPTRRNDLLSRGHRIENGMTLGEKKMTQD